MKVNGDRLILRRVNRGDIDVNLSSELIFRRSSVVIARSRRRISISFRNNIQCQIKKKKNQTTTTINSYGMRLLLLLLLLVVLSLLFGTITNNYR
jgi:hypothetical protein